MANALEIAEQYRVKERQKMATEIAFKPFKPLRSEGNHLEDKILDIQKLIERGQYEEAIDASEQLMTITLAGFRYLQTYPATFDGAKNRYDWLFLRSLVTAGFLGWTLFVLVHIFDSYVLSQRLAPNRGPVVISSIFKTNERER
jgi:phosphatidylinositol glycan class N